MNHIFDIHKSFFTVKTTECSTRKMTNMIMLKTSRPPILLFENYYGSEKCKVTLIWNTSHFYRTTIGSTR